MLQPVLGVPMVAALFHHGGQEWAGGWGEELTLEMALPRALLPLDSAMYPFTLAVVVVQPATLMVALVVPFVVALTYPAWFIALR